jgi:hypothetical protein
MSPLSNNALKLTSGEGSSHRVALRALTDDSAARLLAATERVLVQCSACGTVNEA